MSVYPKAYSAATVSSGAYSAASVYPEAYSAASVSSGVSSAASESSGTLSSGASSPASGTSMEGKSKEETVSQKNRGLPVSTVKFQLQKRT